jgi:hypothetical protein
MSAKQSKLGSLLLKPRITIKLLEEFILFEKNMLETLLRAKSKMKAPENPLSNLRISPTSTHRSGLGSRLKITHGKQASGKLQ